MKMALIGKGVGEAPSESTPEMHMTISRTLGPTDSGKAGKNHYAHVDKAQEVSYQD